MVSFMAHDSFVVETHLPLHNLTIKNRSQNIKTKYKFINELYFKCNGLTTNIDYS